MTAERNDCHFSGLMTATFSGQVTTNDCQAFESLPAACCPLLAALLPLHLNIVRKWASFGRTQSIIEGLGDLGLKTETTTIIPEFPNS